MRTGFFGRLLAVLGSALLFGLSFPPASIRPLAWVALAPLFVALRRGGAGSALLLAGVWGIAAAYSIGDWLPRAIETYYLQSAAVGWAVFLGVSASMASPYYMGFAALYRRLSRFAPAFVPLLAGAAWVAAELGRGRLFTGSAAFIGNPWGLVGYSQVGSDPLVQVAALTGVYGISFAIAAFNAGLAELWLARGAKSGRVAAALAALPLLAVLVYGASTLSRADASGGAQRSVALVQGNLSVSSRWRREDYGRNLEDYLRLSRDAIGREPPDAIASRPPEVVFWPESAMTFFFESEPLYRDVMRRLFEPAGVHLVAGSPRQVGIGVAPEYFNTIFSVAPDGEIQGRYDKEYLVPFAEFFPLRSIELLRRRFEGARTFSPGGSPQPLATPLGPAAVAVCNEAMLPEVVARRVAQGAGFIVNPSNDTWIPEPRFAEQQLDIVLLRAVEQRRPLVRVSTSGPSAIVDAWGRVQARTAMGEAATLRGTIAPRSDTTVYARIGDTFAFACLALALLAAAAPRVRGQQSGSAAGERPATR